MLTTGLPYKLMSSVYSGKTALVTGANSPSGVGYALSQQLLRNGVARLIIGVRTKAKGEAARKSLLADPEVKGSPEILIYQVEMLSHDSVLAFSRAILADIPKLDIALLNGTPHIMSHTLLLIIVVDSWDPGLLVDYIVIHEQRDGLPGKSPLHCAPGDLSPAPSACIVVTFVPLAPYHRQLRHADLQSLPFRSHSHLPVRV